MLDLDNQIRSVKDRFKHLNTDNVEDFNLVEERKSMEARSESDKKNSEPSPSGAHHFIHLFGRALVGGGAHAGYVGLHQCGKMGVGFDQRLQPTERADPAGDRVQTGIAAVHLPALRGAAERKVKHPEVRAVEARHDDGGG